MPNSNLDPRLIAISDLMAMYSLGEFDTPGVELSENLDEIDSIISGINMLGEELKSATVSRDFFIDIYNTVSNILLVTDEDGNIIDCNESTVSLLKYSKQDILELNVFDLIEFSEIDIVDLRKIKEKRIKKEFNFHVSNGGLMPTATVWSELYYADGRFKGFLVVAEDLTEKKYKEREILKNITQTQENERARVADDLHDSLGQELASIRMILAGISYQTEDPVVKSHLENCTELLDISLQNIRSICFDLIPSALEGGDLVTALNQVIRKMEAQGSIEFEFGTNESKIDLQKQQQVSIYRVFQEFVHNSIKHANCTRIELNINRTTDKIIIEIKDNGKGFNPNAFNDYEGRGLSTMISRIEANGGSALFTSEIGVGTKLTLTFKTDI